MRPLTLLCAAKLHKNQLERHLELFEHMAEVERVILVRHEPLGPRLKKLENVPFEPGPLPLSLWRMRQTLEHVLSSTPVDWVIGLNPVPWGSVAAAAARAHGLPVALSIIGRDYLQLQEFWARPFLSAVRNAQAVTVTGNRMIEGLVKQGVAREALFILPHSVDLSRFHPPKETNTKLGAPDAIEVTRSGLASFSEGSTASPVRPFDVLSVGQLIPRKQMHVLIEATRLLHHRGRPLRVGILGKGPAEAQLRAQVTQAGLDDWVTFLGYQDHVEAVLRQARLFVLVSAWEGVPFALMEAMATGLVPVVTDVGTISDWVHPGLNGEIVPVGDAGALASVLERLLTDSPYRKTLEQRLIADREQLSFESGVRLWRRIFQTTPPRAASR